jgi:hypothetical protein
MLDLSVLNACSIIAQKKKEKERKMRGRWEGLKKSNGRG